MAITVCFNQLFVAEKHPWFSLRLVLHGASKTPSPKHGEALRRNSDSRRSPGFSIEKTAAVRSGKAKKILRIIP